MQKRVFIVAIIIALVAATATAFLRGDLGAKPNAELTHMEGLYAMKDTDITDKVAVGKVVNSANATEYPLDSIDIWNDAGDDRIDVKFKEADRSEHRYIDYTGIDKTAVLALSLIPDADAIAFYMFDDYGDVTNLETSFNGSYYDRNFVYERNGMDKYHIEYIDCATENFDTFKEYYSTTMYVKGKDTQSDWQDQMYEFIGDDCEIVVNSGMGVDIALDDAFLVSEDCAVIEEALSLGGTGVDFASYPGKGESIHLAKYDVRNFKTGETRKCAVAYCYHSEDGLMMLAQKFLDETEDIQNIREQIIKRY